MSEEKAWYEGLTGKDLAGRHVHVVFKTGTVVDGRLEWDGLMYVSNTRQVAVLGPGNGGSWELSPGVESVSLVWDERDWEQIPIEDVSKADAVVVNGRVNRVTGIWDGSHLYLDGRIIPASFVSCALRFRNKLPTELGAYRGADGTLLIHYRSMMGDHRWRCISRDFLEDRIYADDELVNKYLPLTPVHFVDGRAE